MESRALAETIYRSYHSVLKRYFCRYVRDEDARDLLQDLYVKLLSRETKEAIQNVSAYAYRVAIRLIAEWRTRTGAGVIIFHSQLLDGLDYRMPDGSPELGQALDMSRLLDATIARAAESWPPRYAQILVLLALRHSWSETAHLLGCSPHTVKKTNFVVCQWCRGSFGEQCADVLVPHRLDYMHDSVPCRISSNVVRDASWIDAHMQASRVD